MIYVVLYQPEKPSNVGNIMRTCSATETKLIIIGPLTFKFDDKSLLRAGMDYIDELSFKYYETYEENKVETTEQPKKLEDLLGQANLKNIWGYIKKINPDSISKTLNTVQKVLQITQSFGGKNVSSLYNANYNSWWD